MNRTKHRFTTLMMVLGLPLALWAQGTISGTVSDAATGEALAGANVVVEGTDLGAAADVNGDFSITDVPAGTFTMTASVIGYTSVSRSVNVIGAVTVNFELESAVLALSALEVLANRATRQTPVAFTNVEKEDMVLRLGSRDIPLVLNTTPGVYATDQGGGAGDARVNVRGFNQRNVAIMINGVPVNDMENGWVYWSNWDGVGDATSSIQMQRGLSAVNLATPSIGGTMNIITDPTAHQRGGSFKQELGSWGFLKSTLSYHTGLIGDKLALGGTVVRKTGDGYYKGTWTDAWAYYLGASYALSNTDRFEFYALGAPQRHGQNLYKQNISAFSSDFAKDLDDYDAGGIDKYPEADDGRAYNENYNEVSESYDGKQYWQMYGIRDGVDRFDKGFLNERENYFHKPQVSLNWYHTFNDQMRLSSILYYSGGNGGGTGTDGSMKWDYSGPSRIIDWDATIARNSTNIDSTYSTTEYASRGILRNSVNQQWTIGAISKVFYDLSDELKFQAGIDWRTAEIGHWREVRDLLGGDYRVFKYNDFDTTNESRMKRLGDKIAYYNTNTVDWFGVLAQGEYASGPITGYGMVGYSLISYTFKDHFTDEGGKPLEAENKGIPGYQIKGGGMYRLSDDLGIFANAGYVSKVPIFDGAINDRDGSIVEDPENEKFVHIELGLDMTTMGGMLSIKPNYYNTSWSDRSNRRGVTNEDGSEGVILLTGMNANHSGLELEAAFQPMDMLRVDAALSVGNWLYLEDVDGTYVTYTAGYEAEEEYHYYVKDLKVGDAPQTQFALGASVFPIEGLTAQLVYKYYDNNYADWSPFDRTETGDAGKAPWMAPAYGVMDLHATYDLPVDLGGIKLQAFLHGFNLTDAEYIQDAVDNSPYNAYSPKEHKADDAEVFFGLPTRFNAGLVVQF